MDLGGCFVLFWFRFDSFGRISSGYCVVGDHICGGLRLFLAATSAAASPASLFFFRFCFGCFGCFGQAFGGSLCRSRTFHLLRWDWIADQLFDRGQILAILACGKRDRSTALAG